MSEPIRWRCDSPISTDPLVRCESTTTVTLGDSTTICHLHAGEEIERLRARVVELEADLAAWTTLDRISPTAPGCKRCNQSAVAGCGGLCADCFGDEIERPTS